MKRLTLFAGHYGSGKTNIALNYAIAQKTDVLVDLDIVNPYFRTKDSAAYLAEAGIELVVSDFANSNVDFPALPSGVYSVTADRAKTAVFDIGGDDRGALALGRYAPQILKEGDYEFFAVVNRSRPLTSTVQDTLEVLHEIESSSSGLRFTGIVNNTNLGPDTTAQTILDSQNYAEAVAQEMKLPVAFTCVVDRLMPELTDKIPNLLPLKLQHLYYQFT